MESRIANITRWFFWFGFVVFLTASIPHIAAYYRHFDPNTTGASDLVNWTIYENMQKIGQAFEEDGQ